MPSPRGEYPSTGNQPRLTANAQIIMNASQKPGVANPSTAKNISVRSSLLPERHAEIIPVDTPRSEEMTITWIPRDSVGWSLGRMSSVISLLEKIEVPRSPRSMFQAQFPS